MGKVCEVALCQVLVGDKWLTYDRAEREVGYANMVTMAPKTRVVHSLPGADHEAQAIAEEDARAARRGDNR